MVEGACDRQHASDVADLPIASGTALMGVVTVHAVFLHDLGACVKDHWLSALLRKLVIFRGRALAQRLSVQLFQGGSLEVASGPGAGARFIFRLPSDGDARPQPDQQPSV